MGYTISANITPKAAVRLLVMNEIAIDETWQLQQAESVLDELYSTSISDLIDIIDYLEPETTLGSSELPQFGSLETLMRIPEIMVSLGVEGFTYSQLGFYLKGDVNATQAANSKYGETHGKGAHQLGIIGCKKNRIYFGAFTNSFFAIGDVEKKYRIIKILCFRMRIIQTLLNQAKFGRINGFIPMMHLEKSTQARRAICIKMVLKEMRTLNDKELSRRIDNIYWELENGGPDNAEV